MVINLREFVVTHVILAPGVGKPGPVLGGLTPFPDDPLDPLDPLESSGGFKKRCKNNQKLTFGWEN